MVAAAPLVHRALSGAPNRSQLLNPLFCCFHLLHHTWLEELRFRLAHSRSLAHEPFSVAKSEYSKESKLVLPVQINGKTRGTILVDKECSEDDAFQIAASDEKLPKYLNGKGIRKRIYVPGK